MIIRPVILAGGASQRMGEPKALLRIGGLTLVERIALACQRASLPEPIVVGGEPDWAAGLVAVPDQNPGEGPLGGLLTGFSAVANIGPNVEAGTGTGVFLLACDLVTPSASAISLLADRLRAAASRCDAVVPRGERVDVLHAAYGPAVRAAAQRGFDSGERSIRRVLADSELRVDWLDVYGDESLAASVRDADTPEEFHAAAVRERRNDAPLT